jgi:hypothetical protein
MALVRIGVHGEYMTTSERIEKQSFCYDPDFPPDIAEGLPLVAVKLDPRSDSPVRRALRACGSAAAALTGRNRS